MGNVVLALTASTHFNTFDLAVLYLGALKWAPIVKFVSAVQVMVPMVVDEASTKSWSRGPEASN